MVAVEGISSKLTPAADLTDDLLVEILSRLPAKSICRFRCVSTHWRHFISHPAHRRRLPHTLAGFFHGTHASLAIPGSSPSFAPVLPPSARPAGHPPLVAGDPFLSSLSSVYKHVVAVDCCGGLLLCRCWKTSPPRAYEFVVCNPATKEWVALPGAPRAVAAISSPRLAFDPAVSPHFHVLELLINVLKDRNYVAAVDIFSSEAQSWVRRVSGWSQDTSVCLRLMSRNVFINGMLHLVTRRFVVAAVDTEGKTWRTIPAPCKTRHGFVDHSQNCLYYVNADQDISSQLLIWVLEDYHTEEWILKHSVSTSQLFGTVDFVFGASYKVIAIHPECNTILFVVGFENIFMAYDVGRREAHTICNLDKGAIGPYLAYVPFFSELLTNGH